jgi:hypothetical protein
MMTLGRADARIAVAAAWFCAWQTWVLDRQVGRFIAHLRPGGCAQITAAYMQRLRGLVSNTDGRHCGWTARMAAAYGL